MPAPSCSPPAARPGLRGDVQPAGATGDGLALALRAGAEVRDVEFVQFHPTVLWTGAGRARPAGADLRGGARRGRRPRRRDGQPDHARPAPAGRPRPARRRGQGDHAPDARDRRRPRLARRRPPRRRDCGGAGSRASWPACRAHGIDPVTEPVPVAPAGHYSCGGVAADLDGRTVGARAVRLRRGRVHRRARRQPAGVELATEGLVCCSPLARPAAGRAAAAAAPAADHRRPAGLRRARRRGSDCSTAMTAARRRAPRPATGWRRLPPSWPASPDRTTRRAGPRPGRPPTCTPSPARSLDAAAARARRAAAATAATDSPDRDDEWRGHLVHRAGDAARVHAAPKRCAPLQRGRPRDRRRRARRARCAVLTAAGLDAAGVEARRPPARWRRTCLGRRRHHGRHRRPAGRRPSADLVPASPACSPASRSPRPSSTLVGRRRRSRSTSTPDGTHVAARRRPARPSRGPARALLTAERTALNLPVPPVRRRHADPRAGSTPSRAPAPRSATPARPPRACGPWRSTPCAAAAA